jgi:hypothetical protein
MGKTVTQRNALRSKVTRAILQSPPRTYPHVRAPAHACSRTISFGAQRVTPRERTP